jgi:uncharacterized protein (DUF302 family)
MQETGNKNLDFASQPGSYPAGQSFKEAQMMKTTPVSISVRTGLRFEECLGLLRQKLQQQQFRIVSQIQFDREFENTLGLHWRKHTVLVVWNSFYAYQALLCGLDGGLFLPFNISVSEDSGSTLIATTNRSWANSGSHGPVGITILTRELNRTMEQILTEFAFPESTASRSALARQKEGI